MSLRGAAQLCELCMPGALLLSRSAGLWFAPIPRQWRHGVDGAFLQQLIEQGLVNDFGLLPLQARKIVSSFCALQA